MSPFVFGVSLSGPASCLLEAGAPQFAETLLAGSLGLCLTMHN